MSGRGRSATVPGVSAASDYPHVRPIPTRWKDNDVYGHVNNVEYYAFFDPVITRGSSRRAASTSIAAP